MFCFFVEQGVDLRQYSKQVETELQRIEQASIKDCIHFAVFNGLIAESHKNMFRLYFTPKSKEKILTLRFTLNNFSYIYNYIYIIIHISLNVFIDTLISMNMEHGLWFNN